MLKKTLSINSIPALLWGQPSERLLIAVHGFMGSKDDFAALAEIAESKGLQVLSFDLPEHGDRKEEPLACNPPNAVKDLVAVMTYAQTLSRHISLYGCSLGAYFSLLAWQDLALEQCLFLSPVVDMQRLIANMMQAAGVNEERLQMEKVIANPYGPQLEWEYYTYVKTHPITKWNVPTAILMGAEDEVSEVEAVKRFAARFNASLKLLEGGQHYLHTEAEAAAISEWLRGNLVD